MPKTKNKKIVLLDVHAIVHRAYHALPDFVSGDGEPTGALYGLSSMLMRIVRELEPDHIVACYDLPEPTFRHEVYKEYKAGRQKTDDSLVEQLTRSYDIFEAFGIPVYEKEGFEADDILGTIVHESRNKKDVDIIIASGDMDTLQLVSGKRVRVFTLRKGITDTVLYDEEKVKERFGFSPDLLPDYKGLRGDPSDNIIGVKGVGEKTATILIKEFGTLENMYKALKKDEQKFLDVGIKERIITLLKEGEEEARFSKVLAQIRHDAPIEFSLPKKSWDLREHKDQVLSLFTKLTFRTLALRLKELAGEEKEEEIQSSENNKEEVEEEDVEKTGIALWLLNSNLTNPNEEDILSYANTASFAKAKEKIYKDLAKDSQLQKIYNDIELPLVSVLRRAEERGVLVDITFLKTLSKKHHATLSRLEKAIWKMAGGEFNINSPKQLGEILYDKLQIKVARIKKTEGGARSTKASELEKMKEEHPIIEKILHYRELQKLLSTYIDNIPDMLDAKKRLHTNFIQTGTTTGRFASQNPNLQNIPIRTDHGKEIRKAFIADKGHVLLAFDYSQIELRIAALLSKDKKLTAIFKEGKDVHTATASEMYNVPFEKVTKDMRRAAKVINFGIIYGMGVNALKTNLGTSREEAQKFYDTYFKTFDGLAAYIEKNKQTARRVGYTETFFGRKRYFPGLKSSLPFIRAQEERMAINAPFQGTSADMIKLAMSRINNKLEENSLLDKAHIILQIHDELIFEVEEKSVKKVIPFVKECMEGVMKECIPFVVDVSRGYNWGELQSVKA